jgi:hypothetical protein
LSAVDVIQEERLPSCEVVQHEAQTPAGSELIKRNALWHLHLEIILRRISIQNIWKLSAEA